MDSSDSICNVRTKVVAVLSISVVLLLSAPLLVSIRPAGASSRNLPVVAAHSGEQEWLKEEPLQTPGNLGVGSNSSAKYAANTHRDTVASSLRGVTQYYTEPLLPQGTERVPVLQRGASTTQPSRFVTSNIINAASLRGRDALAHLEWHRNATTYAPSQGGQYCCVDYQCQPKVSSLTCTGVDHATCQQLCHGPSPPPSPLPPKNTTDAPKVEKLHRIPDEPKNESSGNSSEEFSAVSAGCIQYLEQKNCSRVESCSWCVFEIHCGKLNFCLAAGGAKEKIGGQCEEPDGEVYVYLADGSRLSMRNRTNASQTNPWQK